MKGGTPFGTFLFMGNITHFLYNNYSTCTTHCNINFPRGFLFPEKKKRPSALPKVFGSGRRIRTAHAPSRTQNVPTRSPLKRQPLKDDDGEGSNPALSLVRKKTLGKNRRSLAAGEGFEPSHTESESAVLPLHNPAMFADEQNLLYIFDSICQHLIFGKSTFF